MLEGMEPTMIIRGKPYYVNFVGVDRETGEVKTPKTEFPDDSGKDRRTADFARGFGLVKIKPDEEAAQ